MLQLNRLSLAYQTKLVVHQVSFTLEKGEIGCLLGPSGCGKTSILRAIAGFESITHGQIKLRNKLVSDAKHCLPPEKRQVAVVFQDFALFPHLNISQNIAFGLQSMSKADKERRVTELLELVG